MPRASRSVRSYNEIMRLRQRAATGGASAEKVALRDAGICLYCRGQFKPAKLTQDHVVPLARGGDHDEANIAWVCRRCNSSKGDRFLLEWVVSGTSPVYEGEHLKSRMRDDWYYPHIEVVGIEGEYERLACGHLRAPRYSGRFRLTPDTGKATKRQCLECGSPASWKMKREWVCRATRQPHYTRGYERQGKLMCPVHNAVIAEFRDGGMG